MKRDDVPTPNRAMYDLAMSGKSRKAAIRVHCVMCMGWQIQEVARCTAPSCPLFPYRMGAVDDLTDADNAGLSSLERHQEAEAVSEVGVAPCRS